MKILNQLFQVILRSDRSCTISFPEVGLSKNIPAALSEETINCAISILKGNVDTDDKLWADLSDEYVKEMYHGDFSISGPINLAYFIIKSIQNKMYPENKIMDGVLFSPEGTMYHRFGIEGVPDLAPIVLRGATRDIDKKWLTCMGKISSGYIYTEDGEQADVMLTDDLDLIFDGESLTTILMVELASMN